METMSTIPVVDLMPWFNHKDLTGSEVAQSLSDDICHAFRTVGFVYIKNHGIPDTQLDALRHMTRQFFSLPIGVKDRYALRGHGQYHGWIGHEKESLNPGSPGDLKESYSVVPWTAKDWPDDVIPDFQATCMSFFRSCFDLSNTILRFTAQGLGLQDPDVFSRCHNYDRPNTTALRCLHYPALPDTFEAPEGQLRCGEHSDYGSITLLFQDDVGGLEVATRSGHFIPATPIEGTVLINIGDLLQRWTSDTLVSTRHRVVIPQEGRERERYSFAFFSNPDNDCVIRCVDGSEKYPVVNTLQYIDMKFKAAN